MKFSYTLAIPTYNSEPTILEALDSLLALEGKDALEVIVSDDASRDGTVAAVRAWAERHGRAFRRFELIAHPENIGISANHTEAFRAATGDYGFYLGGDDKIDDPRMLRLLDAYLRRRPVRIGKMDMESWYDDADLRVKTITIQRFFFSMPQAYQRWCLLTLASIFPGGPGTVLHIPTLRELGYFDRDIGTFEDLQVNLKFLNAGHPIRFIPIRGVLWRRHRASLSFGSFRSMSGRYEADNERVYRRYVSGQLPRWMVLSRTVAKFTYVWQYSTGFYRSFRKLLSLLNQET